MSEHLSNQQRVEILASAMRHGIVVPEASDSEVDDILAQARKAYAQGVRSQPVFEVLRIVGDL